jgi:predicted AlkP superfamily phosphohydrolase/phosphomutase
LHAQQRRTPTAGVPIVLACIGLLASCDSAPERPEASTPSTASAPGPANGLHWFIPDGMRAEPELFDIYRWAQEGRLPNIKALMEQGSYGWSVPTFPSHTPTNFATLLTGSLPETHGVADGPMRVEGNPLAAPSVGGFRSTARRVPAVWTILEEQGKRVAIMSVPGSTPPELRAGGTTIRGRWGGWGAEHPSLMFERSSPERRRELARSARLFFLGQDLTSFVDPVPVEPWDSSIVSHAQALELELPCHGVTLWGLVIDSSDDGVEAYDRVLFSADRQQVLASLGQGEWSEWLPVQLPWSELTLESSVRLNVGKLDPDGFFRLRMLVDALNRTMAEPADAADTLRAELGPMVDYVDSYPPQLIHFEEDRTTFLDEARMSLAWHRDAVGAVYRSFEPDVFIHDIYTPNQMLTSRWWLGAVDPGSARYAATPPDQREARMAEVLEVYEGLDAILGEAMASAPPGGLVVLSSDHGAAPLDRWVRLNNHFAEQGWLATTSDPVTGTPVVDWDNTRVVYLKMDNIYVHPDGLGGDWTRGSGPAYEALRAEVITSLEALADTDGTKPVVKVVPWEQVEEYLDLPPDRVGDLVVANKPGYGWDEELTEDGEIFGVPLKAGYKQAILADEVQAMWTPFIIAGPGIRAGHRIEQPIRHIDQLPTILQAMGVDAPDHLQGRVLGEVLLGDQP